MTRRAWLAFASVSVLWGIPYLFIKYAEDDGLTPTTIAWGRVTLATVILLAWAWRRGTLGTLRGRWGWLLAYAFFEVVIPFPMIAVGERHVASSLTAIIIASVPLIGAVLALRFDRGETPTPVRAAGLAVGFVGVIALVGIDIAGSSEELLGAGAILIAAAGYAIGPMILKLRLDGLDPPTLMGGGLLLAAIMLTPLAAIDLPTRTPTIGAWGSLVVLGVLCTTLAFVIMTVLIREAGTGRAMVITYVNPVIALGLGVTLLSERPGAGAIVGLVLILSGSWVSTTGRLPGRHARPPAAADGARPPAADDGARPHGADGVPPPTGPGTAAAAHGQSRPSATGPDAPPTPSRTAVSSGHERGVN